MDERDPPRDDWFERDPERDEGGFASKVIPDLFRRALMTGIGSVFMTEEGIRSALSDMKMPKEAMNYVVNQADRTKRELISTLARELRSFLNDLELDELLRRSLVDTTFEINTTITVRRADDGSPKMSVENRTSSRTPSNEDLEHPSLGDEEEHDGEDTARGVRQGSSAQSATGEARPAKKKKGRSKRKKSAAED